MTKTKFVFSYTETRDFEEPLEVTMEVPERSIEEMCEYFQRFLSACGYIFDDGEHIQSVKTLPKVEYPTTVEDILSLGIQGSPNQQIPCTGVRGGMAEDIIKFDPNVFL